MKKYNCSLVYISGYRIEAKNVTFSKVNLNQVKIDDEIKNRALKDYLKKEKSNLEKVNFVSLLIIGNGGNIIMSVGGDAPHEDLVNHSGFWKVEGDEVLPNSFFKVIQKE